MLTRWVILWIYPFGYLGMMFFAVLNYLLY